jgi:hypothetical protein
VLAVSLGDANPFLSGFYRTQTDADGHYVFDALLPDTYIVYALPDTLDVQLGGAYYLGDYQWDESNMIRVDGDVYDVDIALPSVLDGFAIGEGCIRGVFDMPQTGFRARDFYCQSWLREASDFDFCSNGLSNVGVLLLDAAKRHILAFTLTDESGAFHFNGLPFGTYYVMADLPRYGRGMVEEVQLSPEQSSVANLHLFVNDRGHVDMYQGASVSDGNSLSVYPNPISDQMTILGLQSLETYSIAIMDVLGNTMLSQVAQSDLLGQVNIGLEQLSKGIYFLQVAYGSETKVVKLLKLN